MRFSFDLKKRVFAQTLVVLLIGLALGFVFGQQSNPYVIPTSVAYHELQNISSNFPSGNMTSIDSNTNGIVDNSEIANKALIADSALNPVCISADTGYVIPNPSTGLGSVAWTGDITIGLKINGKNLCEDINGCSVHSIEYFAPATFVGGGAQTNSEDPNQVFDNYLYQSSTPSTNMGGGGPIKPWGRDGGIRGFNGDGGVTNILTIGTAPSFRLVDDLFGVGTTVTDMSPDLWVLRDFSPTTAYRILVCD